MRGPSSIFQAMLTVGVFVLGTLTAFSSVAEFIEIQRSDGAHVAAYLYKPSGKGPYPAVIVLHHSRGLTRDLKEFSDDLSGEDYVTLAVDFKTRSGWLRTTAVAYDYLQKLPEVDARRTALVGFSKGARVGMRFTKYFKNKYPPRPVRAFVSYYVGNSIEVEPTPNLAPILFLHGDRDPEVSAKDVVAFCDGQKRLGKVCEARIYEGTSHTFTRKTFYGPYDHKATVDAFRRTVVFLNKHLRDTPIP